MSSEPELERKLQDVDEDEDVNEDEDVSVYDKAVSHDETSVNNVDYDENSISNEVVGSVDNINSDQGFDHNQEEVVDIEPDAEPDVESDVESDAESDAEPDAEPDAASDV